MLSVKGLAALTLVTIAGTAVGPRDTLAAGPRDTLSRARQLYNAGHYDAAIDTAREANLTPELRDASELVMARAYLERFRKTADASDLTAAREALMRVRPAEVAPDDRVELSIGLGEVLYLDDRAGAAAEQFALVLAHAGPKPPGRRERLLDWWASALDRQAQLGSDADARMIEARIVSRMEDELRRDAASASASYWLVVGARGTGDVDRAWAAAIAAWVRASPSGASRDALRADLDRYVRQAIIPERARRMSPASPDGAATAMRQQWESLKQAWAVR